MKKFWLFGLNLRAHLFDARLKVSIVAVMTIFTLAPFFTAMAQEGGQGEDAFILEEIVVSSSRISQKGFEEPTPINSDSVSLLKTRG